MQSGEPRRWTQKEIDEYNRENQQRQWESTLRAAERAHDRSKEFELKFVEAALRDGQEAIRAALAINGGAAIGVLAFVGALASRRNIDFNELLSLAYSAGCFAIGVFSAGLMAAAAYFTNVLFAKSHEAMDKKWELPAFVVVTDRSRSFARWSLFCNWLAVTLGFISLGAFIGGLYVAGSALVNLGRHWTNVYDPTS